MSKSSEIKLYEPYMVEYGDKLYDVYPCELPDVRGKEGRRHWYYEHGTPRELVEADLLDYYKRNDAIWQMRLPGDYFISPDNAIHWRKLSD